MSKHTLGPLFVSMGDEWPFRILTKTEAGDIVFTRDLPCHSTSDKSANDALNCLHFKKADRGGCAAINKTAFADEVLRAAAPDLLEACQLFIAYQAAVDSNDGIAMMLAYHEAHEAIRAAIAKATGETNV